MVVKMSRYCEDSTILPLIASPDISEAETLVSPQGTSRLRVRTTTLLPSGDSVDVYLSLGPDETVVMDDGCQAAEYALNCVGNVSLPTTSVRGASRDGGRLTRSVPLRDLNYEEVKMFADSCAYVAKIWAT